MSKSEQIVYDLAVPFAEQIGCEVAEVEFIKEGSEYYLRVYIDRDEGSIAIDDCEYVSVRLSEELDKKDPISQAYYLEVCSPGIDRKLKREKDFLRFMGREVDVKLYAAIDGSKEFSGALKGFAGDIATIESGGKCIDVKQQDAVWIRLAVKF